jgi:hypothetical protein
MSNVPQDVIDAAEKVSQWFIANNISRWKLGGCASRDQLEELRAQRQQGAEPLDPAEHLMNEAHKYWKFANAHHAGAVQWIKNDETGELLIFTRGEYRDILMNNIANATSPQANALVAAGMMKAVEEIDTARKCFSESGWVWEAEICQQNRHAVLSAIPKESADALKFHDSKTVKRILDLVYEQAGMFKDKTRWVAGYQQACADIVESINSVLEGKS